MSNLIDLTGQTFTRLFVLYRGQNTPLGVVRWVCHCECGEETLVTGTALRKGLIKSCGCWQREITAKRSTKHENAINGKTTREYRSWRGAKERCHNQNLKVYKYYGGRGIRMCEEWCNSFKAFLAYIGPCPPGMTLDRYPNNDGNYEPGNVRWATRKEQSRNRRSNRRITIGNITSTVTEWAERVGASTASNVSIRLNRRKWEPEKAIFQPARKPKCP